MKLDSTSLKLPAGQFIDEPQEKDLIVLHHTVGGSAVSTFDYWLRSPERIATAYLVERDGTIFQTFNPSRWAYHLGLKGSVAAGGKHERRSIGIEIASEGALTEYAGNLYCFDTVSPRTLKRHAEAFDLGYTWRGRRYFDAYEPAQIDAVIELVGHLLDQFRGIPRRTFRDHKLEPDSKLHDPFSFTGILGHADLRADKTDPHPGFPWSDMARKLNLEVIP